MKRIVCLGLVSWLCLSMPFKYVYQETEAVLIQTVNDVPIILLVKADTTKNVSLYAFSVCYDGSRL